MARLSSKATFFYKRIFPLPFMGFMVVFIAVPLLPGADSYPLLAFFIVPIVMIVIFYFFMKKLVFDLVDEVDDLGDTLLVKNGRREDRIALSDIINVNYSPPRVTLSLRKPSLFGSQVTFCAPLRLIPFPASPVIDTLVARVDAARRAARH